MKFQQYQLYSKSVTDMHAARNYSSLFSTQHSGGKSAGTE